MCFICPLEFPSIVLSSLLFRVLSVCTLRGGVMHRVKVKAMVRHTVRDRDISWADWHRFSVFWVR